jgi:hypothetical protein
MELIYFILLIAVGISFWNFSEFGEILNWDSHFHNCNSKSLKITFLLSTIPQIRSHCDFEKHNSFQKHLWWITIVMWRSRILNPSLTRYIRALMHQKWQINWQNVYLYMLVCRVFYFRPWKEAYEYSILSDADGWETTWVWKSKDDLSMNGRH